MNVIELFQLMCRRKLVVVPSLLVVVASLGATWKLPPPTYRASGSILLLMPPPPPDLVLTQKGSTVTQNPYLRVDDPNVMIQVVVRLLHSAPARASLRAHGVKGTYTLTTNLTVSPIIDVADEAATPSEAVSSAQAVIKEAGRQLVYLQAAQGTDSRYFIEVGTIVEPTRATRVFSSALRRLIATGALGTVGVLVVALTTEAAVLRRSARRPAFMVEGAEDHPTPQAKPIGAATNSPARRIVQAVPVSDPDRFVSPHRVGAVRLTATRTIGHAHAGAYRPKP